MKSLTVQITKIAVLTIVVLIILGIGAYISVGDNTFSGFLPAFDSLNGNAPTRARGKIVFATFVLPALLITALVVWWLERKFKK